MPFPKAEDKHAGRPYVTPHRLHRYRAEHGQAMDSPPRTIIVGWQRALLERVKAMGPVREIAGPAGAVLELSPTVGFARLPIGAPVVAVVLEELGVLGVDTELLSCLQAALPDAAVGPTWTTDAPYRETAEEIQRYRSEGILTVDMEAAALFTVAGALGLRAASVFCISDTLHGSEWEPHFHTVDIGDRLWSLFNVVESVLTTTP